MIDLTRPLPGLAGLAVCLAAVAASAETWRPLRIDGHDVRWQRPGGETGRLTLSWRIVAQKEAFTDAINCSSMTSPQKLLDSSRLSEAEFRGELTAAFAMWQRAASIDFVEAAPGATFADIAIGSQVRPEGRAFADVAYDHNESGVQRAITRSLICLNPAKQWKVGFDGNLEVYDLRYTLAHEIGHAIGLDHPGARGSLMWFRYDERSAALQPGDIAGVIALYGARERELSDAGGSTGVATAPVDGANPRVSTETGRGSKPHAIGAPAPAITD